MPSRYRSATVPVVAIPIQEIPQWLGAEVVYCIYRDTKYRWRWFLENTASQKIAESSIGYVDKTECLRAIAQIKSSHNTPIITRLAR